MKHSLTQYLNQLSTDRWARLSVEGLASALYGRYEHAQAIVDAILRAVDEFRGEQPIPDDLTLVAVQLQEAAVPKRKPPVAVSVAANAD